LSVFEIYTRSPYCEEEAQLSRRERAMLHVIEYFAKLLKVIRNDTLSLACVSPY